MKLGIDVDGVLADFNSRFIERVIRVTGRDLFPPRPFEIPTWNYPEVYGYTSAEIAAVWEGIKTDGVFWTSLPPYPNTVPAMAFLERRITYGDDVYFITARPGVGAKRQTERWLNARWPHILNPVSTVLITPHKGLAAQTLGLDIYIDDRWENCLETATMHWKGQPPTCRTFLMNRPWNAEFDAAAEGITRVNSVTEIALYP